MIDKNKELVIINILNYLSYKDTIECVDSLLKINYGNYKILILDNGSENKSYEILKDKYNKNKNILIYKSSRNLGFSKGFNKLIEISKKKYKFKYLVVMNNDMIITDINIIKVLISEINKSNNIIAIGPSIITRNGFNQNPYRKNRPTKMDVRLMGLSLKHNIIYILNNIVNIFKIKNINNNSNNNNSSYVYALHGSFIMFKSKFFKYYSFPFLNQNFLTNEEYILGEIIYKNPNNIRLFYSNKTSIFHKEDESFKLTFKTNSLFNIDNKLKKYMLNGITLYKKIYFMKYRLIKELINNQNLRM